MTNGENSQTRPAFADGARDGPELDQRLLEILVCPLTRSALKYDHRTRELISTDACLAYPIRDGVPIMLPDEARNLRRD
jgi:uncharacterized protein